MKKLQYSSYYDKVLGGWLGKCVGGSLGAPVEGIKAINNIKYYKSADKAQIANDDLDIQLVWVHALKQHGVNLSAKDLMNEWVEHVTFPWSEYGYAMRNFRTGICPPESGRFNNSFYGESMGCPIRSEIWGMISAGNTALAMEYAQKDACLDHYGNSIYAEKLLAAMEAEAFVESDIRKLLNVGLSVIPSDSRLAECINYVIKCFDKELPILETRGRMLNRFGHPDFTSAIQNMGFVVIGLLYGAGDFEKSVVSAVNCGYDSDCTGATVGAILGIVYGASGLPAKWTHPIGDSIVSLLKIEDLLQAPSVANLTRETCEIGIAVSLSGKSDTVIQNPPSDMLKAARQILNKPDPELSIDIQYSSLPSISFNESVSSLISISNHTDKDINGLLELILPEHLRSSFAELDFWAPAKGTFSIEATLSVKPDIETLPVTNQIEVRCTYDGKQFREKCGYSGAAQWLLVGPFWETYPDSAIKPCRFPAHSSPTLPPYEKMVLNFAHLDREYLPTLMAPLDNVNSSPENYYEKILINAPEDKVDLDGAFTLTGPQAVYLYREISCDCDHKAWVLLSANDGVKLWVNGEECLNSADRMYTFPGHHSAEVTLRSGINTILVKLIRTGANYDFSFAIKEHHDQHWHQEQHLLDYSNVRLSGARKENHELASQTCHSERSEESAFKTLATTSVRAGSLIQPG